MTKDNKPRQDLTGQRFGRLVVLGHDSMSYKKSCDTRWICLCNCGEKKSIFKGSLVGKKTKSCGCLQKQLTSIRRRKHYDKGTRLYTTWACMKDRCSREKNKNYKNYGGRGIKVCSEWIEWLNFKEWALSSGYADDLTIERIDVNKGYSSENCIWIPLKDQAINKRYRRLTYKGKSLTVREWAKKLDIIEDTLYSRLRLGMSVEDALSRPVKKWRKRSGTRSIKNNSL